MLVVHVFGDAEGDYFDKLKFSTACGALSGGVTAEIFAGDFGQGTYSLPLYIADRI